MKNRSLDIKRLAMKKSALLCSVLLSLISSLHSANLVNDFSASVRGFNWTDPGDPSRNIISNYTTSYSASVASIPGLVDTGFVTVDYQSPFPVFTTYSYTVDAYNDFGGRGLSLSGITGFLVSLRLEPNNSSSAINFFMIGNNDRVYDWGINTSALSATEFRQVTINLADNSDWILDGASAAWQIGVSASAFNPASTRYNLSIDSVSSVPEPSAGLLLISGLGAVALLRRGRAWRWDSVWSP
ncbi:MAG: PEP-CTERM sorting domain-containing protein [Verrucomicrobia bacterium]|nr:PEP-CTERM sorting domain-containing protein [Verrucomicrobiota bacterium]